MKSFLFILVTCCLLTGCGSQWDNRQTFTNKDTGGNWKGFQKEDYVILKLRAYPPQHWVIKSHIGKMGLAGDHDEPKQEPGGVPGDPCYNEFQIMLISPVVFIKMALVDEDGKEVRTWEGTFSQR